MTSPPPNATVLDATVLSNVAQGDHIELLLDLPRPVTVETVRDELEAGTETHPYLENALAVLGAEVPVITPSRSAQKVEAELLESLDPGEAQALAVAEATDGTLVTDDGDARRIAREREVALSGSIGLLVRAVENGLVAAETADRYLKRWIDEAGFRSPARDIDVFLAE
jgi:predicted nucleic acid-binding protein